MGDYENIDAKEYLFVYGQGIHQSKVMKSYRDEELQFYAQKEFINVSKARQIFLIEWDY